IRLVLAIALFLSFGFQGSGFQLRKENVRKTMHDIFGYHVEYKEFSPMIAKRSLKIFIEQFDPDKVYFLLGKVNLFLEPKEDKIKSVIQKYYQDDLSEYQKLNQIVQEAIVRAQGYREELKSELVADAEDPQMGGGGAYVDYPRTEKELKERIRRQLQRVVW